LSPSQPAERVTLRPTVLQDFLDLQGAPPIALTRCVSAMRGDRLVGLGGLIFLPSGVVAASAVLTEEARTSCKVTLHRAGLQIMRMARSLGLRRVVAFPEQGNPVAERWLLRLGFEPVENGEGFVWHG
jgi:hypothetical protein